MKRVLIILICLMFVIGCKEKKALYKTVSSEEAYDIIETRSDVIILDVRTSSEYQSGHIKDSVNIPLDEIDNRFMEEVTDNYNTTVLVYCQSGGRSEEASKILSRMGFTNVINIGGLSSWKWELEKSEE